MAKLEATESEVALVAVSPSQAEVEAEEAQALNKAESSYADERQGDSLLSLDAHKERGDAKATTRKLVALGIAVTAAVLTLNLALFYVFAKSWIADEEYRIRFLAVGDWGRDGGQNQSIVAAAMAAKADTFGPEFIISVGDNFYESGLTSVEDEQFTTSFTDVYNQPSLQVPWHAIMGNHDYGEYWNDTIGLKPCGNQTDCYFSPLHQLDARLRERDWRWHCERWFQLSLAEGKVDMFFIDTNPFMTQYWTVPWASNRGGISEQSWESQLLELEARLAASTAEWKLVFGHHPVLNNHMPEWTKELVDNLAPVLEAQGVQAYLSGHEHNLQYLHLENATTHYIITGAGSKVDYFPETWYSNEGARWQRQANGFVACEVNPRSLLCEFIGTESQQPLLALNIGLTEAHV